MTVETPAWVRDAVFYQVFPDRFARSGRVAAPGPLEAWDAPPTTDGFKGGDLPGITGQLDQLQELGITALYLTPIFTSAANHRYHPDDYGHVDPLLGGDEALRELLDAAHARGMRVILDGVFNHTGRGFLAFRHILENGAASPYRDWYELDQARLDAGRPLQAFPPPGWQGDSLAQLGYRAWWDLPALPKLNHANPLVREHLLATAERWIRFGADGWRLDVPEEINDREFWRAFRRRVKAANPEAYIVAEIWCERPERLQGDQFDALMDYPLTEALIGFTAGANLDLAVAAQQDQYAQFVRHLDATAFAERLEHLLGAYDPAVVAVQLNLLGSHDTPRFLTVCGGDLASLRLATLVQMGLAGAPCIYYGDEVGLAGGKDPDCRRAYPPPAAWDLQLRAFIKGAIALRHGQPALRGGSFRTVAAAGSAYAFLRQDAASAVVIAINAGEEPVTLNLPLGELDGRLLAAVRWAGWPEPAAGAPPPRRVRVAGGVARGITIPARDGLVLRPV